jgi:hypothetical protein
MPETSLVLQLLSQSVIAPAVVAIALLAALRALRLHAVAAVVAVAAAFIASYFATLHAQWSLVPHVALDWMPWIAVLAAVGALAAEQATGAGKRFALRAVVGLLAAAVIVWGAVASLGAAKAALAVVTIALLVAIVWTAKATPADGGARRPLLLAMVAGGTGLSLMLDSSQQIGQLTGALAVALGVCMLFNLPRSRVAFPPAASGAAVVLLGALVANAHLYAGFSLGYVALLLGALLADPILAAAGRLRGRHIDPHWVPAAVLTAIPVLVTVGMVLKTAQDHGGY